VEARRWMSWFPTRTSHGAISGVKRGGGGGDFGELVEKGEGHGEGANSDGVAGVHDVAKAEDPSSPSEREGGVKTVRPVQRGQGRESTGRSQKCGRGFALGSGCPRRLPTFSPSLTSSTLFVSYVQFVESHPCPGCGRCREVAVVCFKVPRHRT
jgi:hypothetical protein